MWVLLSFPELVAHGKVKSAGKRKVVVAVEALAAGKVCARGEVVAVRMPGTMKMAQKD